MEIRRTSVFFILLFLSHLVYATTLHHRTTITNNTNFYGTGKLEYSGCSSTYDSKTGILAPHGTMTLPDAIFTVCTFGCTAHFFLSNDCSGKEIATVQLSKSEGITHIRNKDPAHFAIVGRGHHVTLNQIG